MFSYARKNKAAAPTGGLLVLIVLAGLVVADEQPEQIPADELRTLVNTHALDAVALYREFLALPNDAVHPEQITALNTWVRGAFEERGFTTQLLPTDGSPSVYAERPSANADKTVLIYLQADGQPVDRSAWHQDDP